MKFTCLGRSNTGLVLYLYLSFVLVTCTIIRKEVASKLIFKIFLYEGKQNKVFKIYFKLCKGKEIRAKSRFLVSPIAIKGE